MTLSSYPLTERKFAYRHVISIDSMMVNTNGKYLYHNLPLCRGVLVNIYTLYSAFVLLYSYAMHDDYRLLRCQNDHNLNACTLPVFCFIVWEFIFVLMILMSGCECVSFVNMLFTMIRSSTNGTLVVTLP
jgi:hypothetical protein